MRPPDLPARGLDDDSLSRPPGRLAQLRQRLEQLPPGHPSALGWDSWEPAGQADGLAEPDAAEESLSLTSAELEQADRDASQAESADFEPGDLEPGDLRRADGQRDGQQDGQQGGQQGGRWAGDRVAAGRAGRMDGWFGGQLAPGRGSGLIGPSARYRPWFTDADWTQPWFTGQIG